MEYTYKINNNPVEMEKLIREYFNRDKTIKYCEACPNYKKYWSCPTYAFNELDFLNKFKFVYLIGKEMHIPREDKHKIIGSTQVANYCKEKTLISKTEALKDLLNLEKKIEGSLSLMPGNCDVCDIEKTGCTRGQGEKCRYPNIMRFSLESLGFDVDAVCKFEIGLLLQWPSDGHLPDRLCGVMALMTNERIPIEIIKEHFPDTKKAWRSEAVKTTSEPKKQTSWLEEQAKEAEEEAEASYKSATSWLGFKSEELDSGNYVKDMPWREEENEAQAVMEESVPEEEENKYKWLGFKRTVEEAELDFKERKRPRVTVQGEAYDGEEIKEEHPEETKLLIDEMESADKTDGDGKEEEVPETADEAEEKKPEPELYLPQQNDVKNALSYALNIAKDVSGIDLTEQKAFDNPIMEEKSCDVSKTEVTFDDNGESSEEDDSKYKWLGFKRKPTEDEEPEQAKWKRNKE